jgi:hypothetical protein
MPMKLPSIVLAAIVVVAGCGPTVNLPIDPLGRTFCGRGVGLDAVLHGSPADPRVAWAVDRQTGSRFELIWPPGYHATFAPQLAISDATGRVVGREGDLITGGCTDVQNRSPPVWVSVSDLASP